jgi:hypothetical protein
MRAAELVQHWQPSLATESYMHTLRGNSPLDTREVQLSVLIGKAIAASQALIEGKIAFLLQYKGKNGCVSSFDELEDGEVWNVLQLQGCKSRKSYRLHAGFAVGRYMADTISAYAIHPESEARQIRMPAWHRITNIDGAKDFGGARDKYQRFAGLLELQYSDELDCYVRDIRHKIHNLDLQSQLDS